MRTRSAACRLGQPCTSRSHRAGTALAPHPAPSSAPAMAAVVSVSSPIRTAAAGLDVSAYMVAAAIAQMAADDAASAVFTPLDAENASALTEAAEISPAPLPTFEDLTAVDALVVVTAALHGPAQILTSDPEDIRAYTATLDHADITTETI